MKPDTPGSWIVGGLILAVLVGLHWASYRIGEARRRRKRNREAGARAVPGVPGVSNARAGRDRFSDEGPIP